MSYVLSIIADPARPTVDDALIAALRERAGAGAQTVLCEGVACDLALDAGLTPDRLEEARRIGRAAKADVNVVSTQNRRKKLLIADMDSTIIRQECIDELADFAGKRAEISAVTEQAMRGELDFDAALKARVSMLEGLAEDVLTETFETRIELSPGARALAQTMNAMGAATALVSGGFTFFTARVAEAAGFQHHQANTLLIEDGRLTGAVAAPILGRAAKREALLRLSGERGLDPSDSLAVGDGANDLAMLDEAGLGVAYRAKPAVAEAAAARIDYGDLTGPLYLQGIPRTEFRE